MKKQYILPILGLCAAFFTTACSDEDYGTNDFTRPGGGNSIFLNCQSQLDENTKVIWAADSKIGFFCEQTETVNLAVGVAAPFVGQTEGMFYTQVLWNKEAGEHALYAYVPYNEKNTSAKAIAGNLSNAQLQAGTSRDHLTSNALTYAVAKSAEVETAVPMNFKHALGYVDFNCKTTAKYIGWKVKSIEFSTEEGTYLAGNYAFDLTTELFAIANGSSKIKLSVNKAPDLKSGEVFHGYMFMNPLDLSAKQCNVEVIIEKAGQPVDIGLSGSITVPALQAGDFTTLNLDLDNLQADAVEDKSVDLSAVETANCYIAGTAGQEYRFKATVMGNGKATPAGENKTIAPGITPAPLSPASVAILWQSEKNLLSGVTLKNNYIYFTLNGSSETPLVAGNAVIAAYDDAGAIVWSWHIWVTDVDLNAKVQTYTVHADYSSFPNYQSPVMMDRNLGATDNNIWSSLTDPKGGHGLFYQWGRKDPIIGPSTNSATTHATVYNGENQEVEFSFTSTTVIKRADIAKTPMSFVKSVAGETVGNWFAEDAYDLWGNSVGWAADGSDGTTGTKSIYDPCPPGYRVPHPYVWSGFTSTVGGGRHTDANPAKITCTLNVAGNITTAGGVTFDNNGVSVVSPSTGFILSTSGVLQRVAPAGNGCVSLWANAGMKKGFSAQFYYDAATVNTPKANHRAMGYGVRCMKDKATN